MELDVDFMKNEGVGYQSDTMLAAFGWEWRMFPAIYIRLGYTQNLIEDIEASFSACLGIRLWALLLDGAFVADEDGEGVYANALWEF